MSDFIVCTKDDPWTPAKGTPVRHIDTREVGDQKDGWPGGDVVTIECLNCGTQWKKELPQ